MRIKLSVCQGLVIMGVLFASTNVFFLWNQQDTASKNCVCNCHCDSKKESNESYVVRNITSPPVTLMLSPTTRSFVGSESKLTSLPLDTTNHSSVQHKLAVVVPFRDRYEEMIEFVPHIHEFLTRQSINHHIWIINQVDSHRFNRASLLNIGFLLSRNECDFMVMHDIDLLPLNDHLKYEYPSKGPYHVSSPQLHPLYHYKTFVGGILILSREQFEKVNGLSNLFWGWGREDDELYTRMVEQGMKIHYPQGITTGHKTFRHIHDRQKRPRDQKKYHNQWDMSRRKDRRTGLSNVKYKLVSNIEVTVSGAPFNFVSVQLDCDYKVTPFCDNPS